MWFKKRANFADSAREFQEIKKFHRKTCCPQKGRGKKKGRNCGAESLSKWESKKGKEIRDLRKDLKIYFGGTIDRIVGDEIYHGDVGGFLIPKFWRK